MQGIQRSTLPGIRRLVSNCRSPAKNSGRSSSISRRSSQPQSVAYPVHQAAMRPDTVRGRAIALASAVLLERALLVSLLMGAPLHAAGSEADDQAAHSRFIDSQDGWLDVSSFLDYRLRFCSPNHPDHGARCRVRCRRCAHLYGPQSTGPGRTLPAPHRKDGGHPPWYDYASRMETGFAPHIRSQYSRIDRSEENLPEPAVLRIDMRVQRF